MHVVAYLDFDNSPVPAGNLIGEEGDGFRLIMHNFNHERFYISCTATRLARVCVEESIKVRLSIPLPLCVYCSMCSILKYLRVSGCFP